jgi:hypothetical protein
MLVPLYTAVLPASTGGYGVVSNVYAFTALMLVLLTFGMETGFFRFANKSGEDPMKVYANSLLSVGGVSLIFVLLCLLFLQPISNLLDYGDHPEFIAMMAVVVALDSFQCIPFADYEVKGVPVRLVMGGRDLENNTMEVMRRDTLEKETRSCDGIEEYVKDLLEEIQANIYKKALDYRNSRITTVDSYDEFKEKIEEGGFILAHWDGTTETEEKIKEETKATIRCIPFDSFVPGDKEPGKCMVTGKPSACRVIFARSY